MKEQRVINFNAFKDFGNLSLMFEDVSIHAATNMVGIHHEQMVETLENVGWKINEDDQLENTTTGDTIDFDKAQIYDSGEDYYFIEDAKLLQNTGLKDKEGKGIYEQDILEDCKGNKWLVFWHQDHACFGVQDLNKNHIVIEVIDNQNMKVVGNIYQSK